MERPTAFDLKSLLLINKFIRRIIKFEKFAWLILLNRPMIGMRAICGTRAPGPDLLVRISCRFRVFESAACRICIWLVTHSFSLSRYNELVQRISDIALKHSTKFNWIFLQWNNETIFKECQVLKSKKQILLQNWSKAVLQKHIEVRLQELNKKGKRCL